jgi:hypothetical protein
MVKAQPPKFFEELVVDLLVKMGYGGQFENSGIVTRYTKDEGIDGVIKEDKLGLDKIYIQAKRWEDGNVGRKEIQSFVGALTSKNATKGVFITTSKFTKEAREYNAGTLKIVLIDGLELCNYMIEYNLGVSVKDVYEIKRIDSDYFQRSLISGKNCLALLRIANVRRSEIISFSFFCRHHSSIVFLFLFFLHIPLRFIVAQYHGIDGIDKCAKCLFPFRGF